ncbi:unnamed protein product, partial [Prorocentrum cordatum]
GARFGLQTAKMARLFPRQSRWRRKRRRRRRRRGRNEEEGGEGGAPACAQQRSTHTQHTKNYGVRVRAAGRAANADSGSSERGRSQRGHAGRDLESIWVGSGERGGGATGRRPGAPRGGRIERGPDGAGACRAAAEGHMPTPRARPCHGGG